jgi:Ca2+-binding EF-hand superfamily protein
MRAAWLCLAALVLFPVCWLPAADPQPSKLIPVPGDEEDIVFLNSQRPYRFRLHLQSEGRAFRADWNDVVAHLFRFLDANGDGVLSKAEQAQAPSAEQFIQQLQSVPVEPDAAPDFGADADKLTLDRFRAHYRRAGGTVQMEIFEVAGGQVLSDALFQALDRNKDGKLSRDELLAAEGALAKLDANSDEILTPREITPQGGNPSLVPIDGGPKGKNSPLVLVPPGDPDTSWRTRLLKEYDANKDGKLSRKEIGLEKTVFDRLDVNHDGFLSETELGAWLKEPADLELVVELGKRVDKRERVVLLGPRETVFERSRVGAMLFPLGDIRLDLLQANGEVPGPARRDNRELSMAWFRGLDRNKDGYVDSREATSQTLNFAFVPILRLADLDGDGKISEKEMQAYIELQRKLIGSSAALEFTDHGRSLFDFLDADQDGRLAPRELKTAWTRLAAWDRDGDKAIAPEEVPHQFRLTVTQGRPQLAGAPRTPNPYVVRTVGRKVERTAGPLWFRKMDRNGDGDVSPREFLGRPEDFRRIDTDGDGLIDAEEAERADREARKAKP